MKYYLFLFFLLVLGCLPKTNLQKTISRVGIANEHLYGSLEQGLPQYDTLIKEYYPHGAIKSVGRYAVSTEGTPSRFKVGYWQEYAVNGQLKAEGNYRMGSLLDCCTGGLCRAFYHYRLGLWKYYNQKADLLYMVDYLPTTLFINTRCGGDSVKFALIQKVPVINYAQLAPDQIYELQKVELEEGDGVTTFTPLNGRLFVTHRIKE
jgi:hypothetical protein